MDEQPHLEIPLPPPSWYEEMLERDKEKKEKEQLDPEDNVIIIEL
jgi:hypothetical protein